MSRCGIGWWWYWRARLAGAVPTSTLMTHTIIWGIWSHLLTGADQSVSVDINVIIDNIMAQNKKIITMDDIVCGKPHGASSVTASARRRHR